jgi:hypothetical protein
MSVVQSTFTHKQYTELHIETGHITMKQNTQTADHT